MNKLKIIEIAKHLQRINVWDEIKCRRENGETFTKSDMGLYRQRFLDSASQLSALLDGTDAPKSNNKRLEWIEQKCLEVKSRTIKKSPPKELRIETIDDVLKMIKRS